ncbi:MAG: thioredoxin [Actinobacteria bacterium]|nr:thioredoxin [Actinomycetota bacterium]MBV8961218.1 thioredoxin [Actinomycetota bacterium]MBV9665340.1 thioredoxin [Actinomycetota bacterium]MBV9935539.1 thioredoxin [Actinomycetota bacterium]
MAALDVTDATFQTDVIERSKQVPVVVDLWAEWCGPCKTLGPIIEKVIDETGGKVVLAKVDVDANPQVAQAFRVQSIPAVYALRNGEIVDSFIGALPEQAVRQFVDGLAPAPSEADTLVAAGDEASLRRALELDPDHEGAIVALGQMLVERGDRDEALALLARIPETAETRRVAALARVGASGNGAVDDIEQKLEALLDRVKEDDDARQQYVDLLELLGPDDPRTAQYRKSLTARLY